MKYVFEDSPTSGLSLLFRKAFTELATEKFESSGGNGGLLDKSTDLLNSEDTVIAFIDLIEDNEKTVDIFNNLWKLHSLNPDRFLLFLYFVASTTY